MLPERARQVAAECRGIPGWFSTEAAMLFAWIDEIQKRNNISGDVFEIGCHHGRSTVFLGSMLDAPNETLGVCDIFDDQVKNTSGSGSGCLGSFSRNMRRHVGPGVPVQVFQQSSRTLTVERIGDAYRFFHIDGGHNADEALSDLTLAASVVIESGVIVLDDPFRPEWPGVTEALIRFLDAFEEFVAIVVGFNKLVLAQKMHSALYAEAIRHRDAQNDYALGHPWRIKQLPFHGAPLHIFYLPSYHKGAACPSPARRSRLRHVLATLIGTRRDSR